MMPEDRNEMRDGMVDAELDSALKNFRLSVRAWSEAELSRPRTVKAPTRTAVWRMAAGWAMGCVLVLGVGSVGVHEHERRVPVNLNFISPLVDLLPARYSRS